jgi:hypothetical protein
MESVMKKYNGIMLIGDISASSTRPGRRIDGDFFNLSTKKIAISISIAKERNLKVVILGSLVAKAFEVGMLSKLINILQGYDVLVIAGSTEYKQKTTTINPYSTCKLLSDSGIINLAELSGISEVVTIKSKIGDKNVCLYAAPEWQPTPANIGLREGVKKGEIVFVLSRATNVNPIHDQDNDEGRIVNSDWPGVSYYVTNESNVEEPIRRIGSTTWLKTGPLVRTSIREKNYIPCVWEWNPDTEFTKIEIDHEKFVFDDEGFASETTQKIYKSSDFIKILKKESKRVASHETAENFIESEIEQIYKEINISSKSREIIDEYVRKTSAPSNMLEGLF